MNPHVNDDILAACIDLVERTGSTGFEIGYLHDDVPIEQAAWWAHAAYQGARIAVENQTSPTNAALALAQRLLNGATCRCGKLVTLSDTTPGCRWRLIGQRWEPGCTAPAVRVYGRRGDLNAAQAAVNQRTNRAERRKKKKGR